jgi:hypothetical protein
VRCSCCCCLGVAVASVIRAPPWVPFGREAVVSLLPGSHGFEPEDLRFFRAQAEKWYLVCGMGFNPLPHQWGRGPPHGS